MLNKIIDVLQENKISTYLINEDCQETVELFFIKKRLDMRREKDVRHYSLTVYREFMKDDVKMLGSSTVGIVHGMTKEEISELVNEAYFAASFVCNPYYELPSGSKEDCIHMQSSLADYSLAENAKKITEALFVSDTLEDVFINSAEVFVKKLQSRIVNSNGIDVSYEKYAVSGEFVVQCVKPQDVETYQSFSYSNLETKALEDKVKETLDMTKARALANTAPTTGDYTVILSGKNVKELFGYYLDRSSASMIYPKYSNYELACSVQGEDVTGELLNITLSAKVPYSNEGIRMIERPLLKDGILQSIHGNSRFSYYLGIKPTGNYDSIKVPSGSVAFSDMKTGSYLHVVNFSSFDMDSLSGHFAGEIRLAFLCDGDKVTPVTGGSINGSILDAQKTLVFSKEMQIEESYTGPYAVALKNVSVAGA